MHAPTRVRDTVSRGTIVVGLSIEVYTARLPDNLKSARVGKSCCDFFARSEKSRGSGFGVLAVHAVVSSMRQT